MHSKMGFFNIKGLLAFITLAIMIVGCLPESSTPVSSSTPTFSKHLPATWTPTITPAPTKTIISTLPPSATLTLSPSLTPLPTVPFDEIPYKFEILLATNGGCRLPCFWGMTPGETTVSELVQFAGQFSAFLNDPVEFENGIFNFYYVTFKTGDSSFVVLFFAENETLQAVDIKLETAKYSFPLAKLLNDYGLPEKILIGPDEYTGTLSMIVLYESQRIVGRYSLYQNHLDDSLYCYDPQSISQHVVTWAPGENWLAYVNKVFSYMTYVIPEASLKPLNEVSDYDVPSFHEKLKIPNRSLCMEIQIDKIHP